MKRSARSLSIYAVSKMAAVLLIGFSGCAGAPEGRATTSGSGPTSAFGGSASAGTRNSDGANQSGTASGGSSGGQTGSGGSGGSLGGGGQPGELGGASSGGSSSGRAGNSGGRSTELGGAFSGGAVGNGGATRAGGAGGTPVGTGGTFNAAGGLSSGGVFGGTTGSASGGITGGSSPGGATTSGGSGGALGVCSGASAKAVTIYTIGDSTMSVYAANLYPRMGWGQPLGELFDARCASVIDKALSGRSSKSFFNEGAWTPIQNALKSGDYVLIQFGHNDEKSDEPTLYTEPQSTYKEYLTRYVNDTREKQATPILLTSIQRNNWSGQTLKDTHGAYPPAVRELAQSLKVDLIDLAALTKAYFERIGPTQTAEVFLILQPGQFPNYPNGVTDNTHLREAGARTIGRLAMADAYAQKLSLATLLRAVPSAP